jgi:hypothetical protein
MAKATLNKQGITTKAGDMTVYNYDGETREYLTSSVEFLALGVGIPANSCTDAPVEEKEGFAVCRRPVLTGGSMLQTIAVRRFMTRKPVSRPTLPRPVTMPSA